MDPELAAVFQRRLQQQEEQQKNESSPPLQIDTTAEQTSPLESSHRDAPSVHEEEKKEKYHVQDKIASTKSKDQRNEDEPRSQDRQVRKDDVKNSYGYSQEEKSTAWEKHKKQFLHGMIFLLMVTLIFLIVSLVQFRRKHANSPKEIGRYGGDGYVPNDGSPNAPSAPIPIGNIPRPSPLQPTAAPTLKMYLEDEMRIAVESDDAKLAVAQLLEEAKESGGSNGEVPLTPKTVQRFALINMDLALVRSGNSNSRQSELIWGKFNQDECKWTGVTCNDDEEVTDIRLGQQGLVGTIPTEVGLLQSLSYLNLSKNNLQGSLPEELYDVVSLKKLFLYKNELTGTISTKIGDLFGLTDFILHNNRITGPIPSTLRSDARGIFGIRYFNVYNNQMTGILPANQKLRQMYYMDLGKNQFSGTLPAELGVDFIRLRHLYLDHNRFSGTVPSSIINAGGGRLHSLRLNDNQLQGALPGDHQFVTELTVLAVQNNQFTSLDQGTCQLWVLDGIGELVEFNSDCAICDCRDNKSTMCQQCSN